MKINLIAFHVGSLSTSYITLGRKEGAKTSELELGHSGPRTYFTVIVGSLSQKRKQTPSQVVRRVVDTTFQLTWTVFWSCQTKILCEFIAKI